ncbi:MAG: ribonuclease III [bacterium]
MRGGIGQPPRTVSMTADLELLETAIGHTFSNRALLIRALTHTSHAYETNQLPDGDNERMEFLGDSILGFLVSEALVERYPKYREGRLSILKNYLVSASNLHAIAQRLGLGEHLLLGRGEELSGGRVKRGLLADAMEALIAAVYLDGGLDAARRFVRQVVVPPGLELPDAATSPYTNYKGALQEIARTMNLPSPKYSVVAEHGPAHARRFTVEVRLGPEFSEQAEGESKKSAGQKAAQLALQRLVERAG